MFELAILCKIYFILYWWTRQLMDQRGYNACACNIGVLRPESQMVVLFHCRRERNTRRLCQRLCVMSGRSSWHGYTSFNKPRNSRGRKARVEHQMGARHLETGTTDPETTGRRAHRQIEELDGDRIKTRREDGCFIRRKRSCVPGWAPG